MNLENLPFQVYLPDQLFQFIFNLFFQIIFNFCLLFILRNLGLTHYYLWLPLQRAVLTIKGAATKLVRMIY